MEYIQKRVEDLRGKEKLQFKGLYSLGSAVLRICDNEASRHIKHMQAKHSAEKLFGSVLEKYWEAEMLYDWKAAFKAFESTGVGRSPNDLQRMIINCTREQLILQAGCGTGKTAAALHFANGLAIEGKICRAIFTLPTRFTTNSMYLDFKEKYGIPLESVGIYHGEVEAFLKERNNHEEAARDTEDWLWDEKYQNTFFNKPINVTTVDHLLYSLLHCYRYADRAFGNIMTSAVIFDELHYYDFYTLRKIGQCMQLLRELNVPHLIMTATLPQLMVEELVKQGERSIVKYDIVLELEFLPDEEENGSAKIFKAIEPMMTEESRVSPFLLAKLKEHFLIGKCLWSIK